MNVLVTGASGYIGHWTCRELLARGHRVSALTRPGSKLRGLPIERFDSDGDSESIERALKGSDANGVIHLAALVRADCPASELASLVRANIEFGAVLLEVMAARAGTRFINASTYWMYDGCGNIRPNTLYAATKAAFQSLVNYHVEANGLAATSIVLFDVYGPHDWRRKLLTAVAEAPAGTSFELTPGEQVIDFVHVRDVARGFITAIEASHGSGHIVRSLSGSDRQTLRSVLEQLRSMRGVDLRLEFGKKPYPSYQIMEPVSTIPLLEGWEPRIPLVQGLAELVGDSQSPQQ